MIEYGNLVGQYTILVLADENNKVELSPKVKVIAVKKSGRISSLFKLKKKAEEILLADKYDIITAQDAYFIGKLAVKLAKRFKLGLEVQVHGFEKLNFIRKITAKYVLKEADAVRVVSQRLRAELISKYNVDENKITVVPIFTDLRFKIKDLRKKENEKFIFLTVGRLVPVKNIEMQIKAMAEVARKYSQAELWIVGKGSELRSLKSEVRRLKIENNIEFLGWQDNLEKFYEQADCFLLTSDSEGWGMAVVEAAQFSLPIIMTDVGLAGEVIKDGESGILIPVGDEQALERAMIILIEDENLRKKLGEGAREAVQKLPGKDETLELYKKSWGIAVFESI